MAGGTIKTQTDTKPWAGQRPYILEGFQQAKDIYNQGVPEYYSGETLAGFDPAQTASQQAIMGYATGPRAAAQQQAAEQSIKQGLSGQVDPNAYNPLASALTQQVMGNLQGSVLPGIRQNMLEYGQQGGGSRGNLEQNKAIAKAVQSGLTKPLADMYTSAYGKAQDRAVSSGQMYPSIMSAPMAMYGAMGDVGAQRRAMSQEGINRDMARYQYQATAPQQALQNYMSMIQGNYGGSSSQVTPKASPLGPILGAVLPAMMGV